MNGTRIALAGSQAQCSMAHQPLCGVHAKATSAQVRITHTAQRCKLQQRRRLALLPDVAWRLLAALLLLLLLLLRVLLPLLLSLLLVRLLLPLVLSRVLLLGFLLLSLLQVVAHLLQRLNAGAPAMALHDMLDTRQRCQELRGGGVAWGVWDRGTGRRKHVRRMCYLVFSHRHGYKLQHHIIGSRIRTEHTEIERKWACSFHDVVMDPSQHVPLLQ